MAPPTTGSGAPRVAVVTVSYASEGVLPEFLDSVRFASSENVAIVVADNKPDSTGVIADITARNRGSYLPLGSNRGYGAAINEAVASLPSTIDWILVSNPDVVLEPDVVDVLVAIGDEDASIGAVGPAILTLEGAIYPSARAIPSLRNGIGHALFANLWMGNPWTRSYRNETAEAGHRRDSGWLSGACLLVRRSAFDALGGFDPGYFMYFEDVDLGYRLGKAGFRNVYAPSVAVRHIGAHSTEGESSAMISAHHESAIRFLTRKYPGAALWPVRAVLTIGLSVRSWLAQRAAR
jgi:N-acetylglucosaminyl-diphospho-decaprenol L-rhamnosyltransferase